MQFTDLRNVSIPEPRWLIPSWLGRDHLNILVGAGGASKSWFALDLSIAASLGQSFFGHELPPLKMAFIDEDGQHVETLRRLGRLCSGRGVQVSDLANRLFLSPSWGLHLDNPVHFTSLKDALIREKVEFVVIDALCAVHEANENDNKEMGMIMRGWLRTLMRDCGVGVLLLHHEGKPGETPKAAIHRARGAGEIINSCDVALSCGKKEDSQIVTTIRSRLIATLDWPEPIKYILLDNETSTHLVLSSKDLGPRDKCIEALRLLPELPTSVNKALGVLGKEWSRSTVGRALACLKASSHNA